MIVLGFSDWNEFRLYSLLRTLRAPRMAERLFSLQGRNFSSFNTFLGFFRFGKTE